jgi:hypothetical protein
LARGASLEDCQDPHGIEQLNAILIAGASTAETTRAKYRHAGENRIAT